MTQLAGLVFDPYDDPTGDTLREIIPDPSDIPPIVKEAQMITPEVADKLPDDNYALILVKEGQKFRKYATVDAGNTALSVLYLLKQAHLLPEEAVKVAASNLMEACNRFSIGAPDQLKLAASGVSGRGEDPYRRKSLNTAVEKRTDYPTPETAKENRTDPQLGQDTDDQDHKNRTNWAGVQGSNFLETPPFSTKERFSNSEGSAVEKKAGVFGDAEGEVVRREKTWKEIPYVSIDDWEPGTVKEASAPSRTLLRGKYPVDTFQQVKTAEAYFDTYIRQFHPRDRRTYCTKLAARMEELGVPVSGTIEKYASPGFGADVEAYVSFRRGFVHEDYHPALDTLLEKQAQVSPDTFAEALCEFDEITNLNYRWDSQIPDPWASTFGKSAEKLASEEWTWDEDGVRVDEDMLKNLGTNGHQLLTKSFGEDFAKEFGKSSKDVFTSLPTPQKRVVGRMAMDHYSGTGTE